MIHKFIKIMGQADEIVGHNVDKFDTKWIRSRAIFHGLEMQYEYKSIDTLKESRKHFNFPSNRLDAICRYLGIGEKIKTTEELWMDIWRRKSSKAMNEMIRYCKRDVLILEEYFNILNKYIKPKIRISENRSECPECGSDHLIKRGYHTTVGGQKNIRLQCQSCRKYTVLPLRIYLKLTK
jgi:uncharacterized protein YprB with RNaseH-like and TPR domain